MKSLMFEKAILRKPCKNMVKGLRSRDLGVPDYDLALRQHASYAEALKKCGLETIILDADERHPDSVFIEDVALLTPRCAIITRPGAASRRNEIADIRPVLQDYYKNIYEITGPGTIEAGDIMMVDSHFYIGLSTRTNHEGAQQLISFLESNGMTGSAIALKEILHLKTGLSYLGDNKLLAYGKIISNKEFKDFNIIEVDEAESYAANCIRVNDAVIVAEGYPLTRKKIESAGYETLAVDVSEFRKLDGGLSCLSLRF